MDPADIEARKNMLKDKAMSIKFNKDSTQTITKPISQVFICLVSVLGEVCARDPQQHHHIGTKADERQHRQRQQRGEYRVAEA